MPLIQLARFREDQATESRGQKKVLQATLAKMQLKKRWGRESTSERTKGISGRDWKDTV
jgi:AAA+ superfamily predicted ATPase